MAKAKHPAASSNKLKKISYTAVVALFLCVITSLITLLIFSKVYKSKHSNEQISFGVTFSSRQAKKLGLEPKQVLTALLDDAHFKRFRLMSYWDEIESDKGKYDYSELDSQINEIEKRGGEITLAIGLRQPRWPECFIPKWAENLSINDYRNDLNNFIQATVNRYKSNPKVISWQLENEFHLNVFGECTDHDRRRLIDEYEIVKSIDATKPIILSLSNNYFGFPVGDPRPDIFGVSIYSKVYESKFLKNYLTYPFPSWYYGGRAGITEALTGRPSMIHELQLEPWGPKDIWYMTIDEQNKSMDSSRVERQLKFAESTGIKPIDLWGGEWWYWRKYVKNDSSSWEVVKSYISKHSTN